MSSDFQPLVPGNPRPAGSASGRVTAAAETAGRFVPLVPGRGGETGVAIQARPPAPSNTTAPLKGGASVPNPSHGEAHKPAVAQVIRDGDRITHIEVRCACGEVITLECGY
jgi:hypothetical protein